MLSLKNLIQKLTASIAAFNMLNPPSALQPHLCHHPQTDEGYIHYNAVAVGLLCSLCVREITSATFSVYCSHSRNTAAKRSSEESM